MYIYYNSLSLTCQAIAPPTYYGLVWLYAGQFIQKDTVRDCTKTLLKSKPTTSAGFPWSTRWLTLSLKEIKLVKKDFCACEPVLVMTSDCVVSQVFFINSENNLLHNFTRH